METLTRLISVYVTHLLSKYLDSKMLPWENKEFVQKDVTFSIGRQSAFWNLMKTMNKEKVSFYTTLLDQLFFNVFIIVQIIYCG